MVRGLKLFRDHFRTYADQYVLIGGTACDLIMEEAGLRFRATKDLDIVLCVEALDASFVRAFWEFVGAGKYQVQEESTGEKRYYRFQKPQNKEYPFMLELFSRNPDILDPAEGAHLTPIPVDEEVSSLSAILLNDDYYAFLQSGKKMIDGIPIVGPEHLIPLKARAWIDLSARRAEGKPVDKKDITKHKNDVFRLYQVLDPSFHVDIPGTVRGDMETFLAAMEDVPVDLKNLGIRNQELSTILAELRDLFQVE